MMHEDRQSAAYQKLPHVDGRCGARWRKLEEVHCYTCHCSFVDIATHDHHMDAGICKGPAASGLVLAGGRIYEAWSVPNPDELPVAWR